MDVRRGSNAVRRLLNIGGPKEVLLLFQAYLCLILLAMSPPVTISCRESTTSSQILPQHHHKMNHLEGLVWTKQATENICSSKNQDDLVQRSVIFLIGFVVTIFVRGKTTGEGSPNKDLKSSKASAVLLLYASIAFSKYFVFPQLTAMHYGYTSPLQLLLSPFVLIKSLLLMICGLPMTLLYSFPNDHIVSLTIDELKKYAVPLCGNRSNVPLEVENINNVDVKCSKMCSYVFQWSNVLLLVFQIIPCLILLIDRSDNDDSKRKNDNNESVATIAVQTDEMSIETHDRGIQCDAESQAPLMKQPFKQQNEGKCRSCSPRRKTLGDTSPQPIQLSNVKDIRSKFPTKPINVTKPLNVGRTIAPLFNGHKSNNDFSHNYTTLQTISTQTDEIEVEKISQTTQTERVDSSDKECQSLVEVSSKLLQVDNQHFKSDASTSTTESDLCAQTLSKNAGSQSKHMFTQTLEHHSLDERIAANSFTLGSLEENTRISRSLAKICKEPSRASIGVNTMFKTMVNKSTSPQRILGVDVGLQHSQQSKCHPNVFTQTPTISTEEKSSQVSCNVKIGKTQSTQTSNEVVLTNHSKKDVEKGFSQSPKNGSTSHVDQSVQCSLTYPRNEILDIQRSNCSKTADSSNRSIIKHNDVNSSFCTESNNARPEEDTVSSETFLRGKGQPSTLSLTKLDAATSTCVTTNEVYVQTLHLTKGESRRKCSMGFRSLSTDVFEDERLQELHLHNDYNAIETLSHAYRMSSSKSTQVDFLTAQENLNTLQTCKCQKNNVEETLHSLLMMIDGEPDKLRCGALKIRAEKCCDGIWYVSLRADIFLTVCQQVVSNIQMLKEVEVVQQHIEDELLRTMKGFLDNYATLSLYFEDDVDESDDESFINGFRL